MTVAIGAAGAGSAPYPEPAPGSDPAPAITDDNDRGVQVAQVTSFEGGGALLVQPPAVDTGRPDLFGYASRGDEGLPIGNWLIFPSTFVGVAFATNPGDSPTGARASPGLLLRSNTIAASEDALNKTVLYSNTDAQLYPDQGSNSGTSANYLNTHTGIMETYQPLLNLIINAQGDFTRQIDYFNSLGVTNNLSTLNTTGVGVAPSANPVPYNQLSGSFSIQDNFADTFLVFGGSIVDQIYDSSSTVTAPAPNGTILTGRGRGGIWIIPDLYGYIETSIDKRDYATTALSSSGFRSVAGLGSDQIGLYRGELYLGYQMESPTSAAIGSAQGPVVGGKVSYFPLPELSVNASLDQTIGASFASASSTSSVGTFTKVTSLLAGINYALAPEWKIAGQGGLASTSYGGSNRLDTAWTVGLSVTYSVWQNFGLTLQIQRTVLTSNEPQTGFTNNVVSLGLSYVY
jgi:hypothetical protein